MTYGLEEHRRCHTASPGNTESHGFTTFPSPSVTTRHPAARDDCKRICENSPARASGAPRRCGGGRTGRARADVENPLVPGDQVPLNGRCEPAAQPRYCGYTAAAGRACARDAWPLHEAQQELLSTYCAREAACNPLSNPGYVIGGVTARSWRRHGRDLALHRPPCPARGPPSDHGCPVEPRHGRMVGTPGVLSSSGQAHPPRGRVLAPVGDRTELIRQQDRRAGLREEHPRLAGFRDRTRAPLLAHPDTRGGRDLPTSAAPQFRRGLVMPAEFASRLNAAAGAAAAAGRPSRDRQLPSHTSASKVRASTR